MDILYKNISSFFDELLSDLNCQEDTKSYIISIYGRYKTADFDLSQDSLTLLFSQARNKRDFLLYQNIADWIFYTRTLAPQFLKYASQDYYETIARLSYYSCYKLTKNQWKCYEQLADEFLSLEEQVKKRIPKLTTNFDHMYIIQH